MKLSALTKHSSFVLATLSLFVLAGCPGDKKEAKQEAQETEKDPDAELGKKMDPYIADCLNRVTANVSKDYSRYTQRIDPKEGPKPEPHEIKLGMGPIPMFMMWPTIDKCKTGVAEANKAQPSVPALEAAGEAYVKTFEKLDVLRADLKKYYNHQDKQFQKDKWKKGKEVHPKYMKAFDDFFAADRQLRDEIDKVQAGIQERYIKRLEAKGPSMSLHIEKMMNAAERLLKEFNRTEKWDAASKKAFSEQISAYEKVVVEGNQYFKENGDKYAVSNAKMNAGVFFSFSEGFVTDLKKVSDEMANLEHPEKNHYSKLSHRYNMVVNSYNKIQ